MNSFNDTPNTYSITPELRCELDDLKTTIHKVVRLGVAQRRRQLRWQAKPKKAARAPMAELDELENIEPEEIDANSTEDGDD